MNIRKIVYTLPLALGIAFTATAQDDGDSLGLPGDNLDLYGVLELFKDAESIEAFEKALNSSDNEVNNLDLNEDNDVDYIRVIDNKLEDAHAFILQVPISEDESQDVAVIELDKVGEEEANLQVVGDEELYGADYIVEPGTAEDTKDKSPSAMAAPIIVVNVWGWRPVRYVYAPKYRVWVSPWRWRTYPKWWKPWRPVRWHVHHRRTNRYRVHHRRAHVYRVGHAHNVYRGHRVTSRTVHRRHVAAHKVHQKRHPHHKPATVHTSYRKTTVKKGPKGKTVTHTKVTKAGPHKKGSNPKGKATGTGKKKATPAKTKGMSPAKSKAGGKKTSGKKRATGPRKH
jgi:hypothetical protein